MEIAGVACKMQGDILYAEIGGDIDHHSAKYIREAIDKEIFLHRPHVTVLELSHVDFMDSSGLGLILGRLRKTGEMAIAMTLVNPNPAVQKILRFAGVENMLDIRYL